MSHRIRRNVHQIRNLTGKGYGKDFAKLKQGLLQGKTHARKIAMIAGKSAQASLDETAQKLEAKIKSLGQNFKLFKETTSEGAVKSSNIFERKIYQPLMSAMPNRLSKTGAFMGFGYTVGAAVSAGLVLGGVIATGPFALVPIIAFGVGFMVFGFAMDVGSSVRSQNDLYASHNIENPSIKTLGQRAAAHIKNPHLSKAVRKGIDGFINGTYKFVVNPLKLAKRHVYEPVVSALPNRLQNAVDYANYGYSGGAVVGSALKLGGTGFDSIPIIAGTAGGFIFGFAVDIKTELETPDILPQKITVVDTPEHTPLNERVAEPKDDSPIKQKLKKAARGFESFWGGVKRFGGKGVALAKRFATKYEKTIKLIGIGVTVGALLGAVVAVSFAGGPFSVIGIMIAGGVVFMVFGLMLDIARNARHRNYVELVDMREGAVSDEELEQRMKVAMSNLNAQISAA